MAPVVVDTMVFAYALLGVEAYREESTAVLQAAEQIWVPDSMRAELVTVLWQWVTHREVPMNTAIEVLRDADALIARVCPTDQLWERALSLAVAAGQPAYDTLFVALAEQQDTRVVTYDRKLLLSFPARVVPPAEFCRR